MNDNQLFRWLANKKTDAENIIKTTEELGELQQAISKYYFGEGSKNAVVEEMADVLISIRIMRVVYNISDYEFEDMVKQKMKRNIDRIQGDL